MILVLVGIIALFPFLRVRRIGHSAAKSVHLPKIPSVWPLFYASTILLHRNPTMIEEPAQAPSRIFARRTQKKTIKAQKCGVTGRRGASSPQARVAL